MANMGDIFEVPLPSTAAPLSLERTVGGEVDVFFRPVPRMGIDGEFGQDPEAPVRILHIDVIAGHLTMFPMNNLTRPFYEVGPKYNSIERISFIGGQVVYAGGSEAAEGNDVAGKFLGSYFGKTEPVALSEGEHVPDLEDTAPTSIEDVMSLLEGLPDYCVKDPQYGLGLKRQYRAVVSAIEGLTVATEIQIGGKCTTGYIEESRVFVLSMRDMWSLTKAIEKVDRMTRKAANTVNDTSTYNTLAEAIGRPKRPLRYGRDELRTALTAIANEEKPLTHAEQAELVDTLSKNAGAILKREPETMEGLESGIVLARAEGLRDQLERMIGQNLAEKQWQSFLRANPYVLSLVFGRPIVKIGEQASVGGRSISGGGEKIADFLVRNSLTNNAALVEIKTPKAKLLNQSAYRKSIFAPSGELVGAINQVLDQKNKFEQDIANIRNRNRGLDVEAHHVHACVLIGVLPTGQSRLRSFELFRHNLKDVVVVTFDELLRKVADLCSFLEGKGEAFETPDEQGKFDVPF